MLVLKQKYYFFLLVFLLLPLSLNAAWTEPVQTPPNGNAVLPVYSTGAGQTIDGTLHVGTPGSYVTGLQGTGSTSGIQGNSVGNALFGNLATGGAGGNRAVYGLAVDANDYALYSSGGLGLGFASGDIWFLQQDAGIAWPRESDGASLYGVYVNSGGELQVRGHGAGINFMNQTNTSRLTISEAGATNVVTGPLTVGGTAVCLQTGAGCPTQTTPTLQAVTTAGNTTDKDITVKTLNTGQGAYELYAMDQNVRTTDAVIFSTVNTGQGGYELYAMNQNVRTTDAVIFSTMDTGQGAYELYAMNQNVRTSDNPTFSNLTVTNGVAAGGYVPSGTHKVTTPTLYSEQAQIGSATGGLKGAGTLNSVQLCIQGDCRSSWAGAAPTPTLQAVTTAGNTTNLAITVAGLTSTAGLTLQGQTFDATNATVLYINAYGDAQIRVDANNNGTNQFKINNGANSTVFTVDESGNGWFGGNLQVVGLFSAGADLAEEFITPEVLEPGTVVIMGGAGYKSAKAASQEYDPTVIGVVSDNAGVIMGRVAGPNKSVIAMIGVVKVKVVGYNGYIKKGDLLTTSNKTGYAMKAVNPRPGTIIGKALESFGGEAGEIMALINLQ